MANDQSTTQLKCEKCEQEIPHPDVSLFCDQCGMQTPLGNRKRLNDLGEKAIEYRKSISTNDAQGKEDWVHNIDVGWIKYVKTFGIRGVLYGTFVLVMILRWIL